MKVFNIFISIKCFFPKKALHVHMTVMSPIFDAAVKILLHLLRAALRRALLLLSIPQAGLLGVGGSSFRLVGFLPAVWGLGHCLSPATTSIFQHPDPTGPNTVLTAQRCCLLQKTMLPLSELYLTYLKNLTPALCYSHCSTTALIRTLSIWKDSLILPSYIPKYTIFGPFILSINWSF